MKTKKSKTTSYQSAFLISNAGTCGDIEKPLLETGHSLGLFFQKITFIEVNFRGIEQFLDIECSSIHPYLANIIS